MSSAQKTNSNNRISTLVQQQRHHPQMHTTQKTPFCKVCMDAGKPEQTFTSHWVKDNQGAVCCPTLLAQKCRYCDQSGHTVKFCTTLQRVNKIKDNDNRRAVNVLVAETLTKSINSNSNSNNKFDALNLDSDDEADDNIISRKQCKEEFPQLGRGYAVANAAVEKKRVIIASTPTISWAQKVALPAILVVNKTSHHQLPSSSCHISNVAVAPEIIMAFPTELLNNGSGMKSKNWADEEDDEWEEEW